MSPSLSQTLNLLLHFKYTILFPIAIFEGPIISVLAGLLVSLKEMNFYLALTLLVLADLVGDMLFYAIGRWGSYSLIPKYGQWVGITSYRFEKIRTVFNKHPNKTLLFGKWSHAFGMVVLISAGATHQKIKNYLLINLAGTIPKTLFFLLIGFYFGQAYTKIDSYLSYAILIITGITIVGIGFYFLISKAAQKYFS